MPGSSDNTLSDPFHRKAIWATLFRDEFSVEKALTARLALLVLLIVGFAGMALALLRADSGDPSLTYLTSEAEVGPLVETVTATGELQALVTVDLGSQLSGRIDELYVDFNDTISKGQPVASLDRQSYEARLSEAEAALQMARASVKIKRAELDRARAELREAEEQIAVLEARRDGAVARYNAAAADLQRNLSLHERGIVTAEVRSDAEVREALEAAALREASGQLAVGVVRVDAARANVVRQEADLENGLANIPQREALLSLAKVELERTIIRAPIDGVVIKRNVSEGQTVAASLEAPTLFTIAQDLGEMELIAWIDETDIGRIRIGQRATFTVDAFPGRGFAGEIVQIRKSPRIIQNVVTYPVVIRTSNQDLSLLPGMTAAIRVVVMESDPILKVPAAAIAFTPSSPPVDAEPGGAGPTVWILDGENGLREVAVVTGARDGSHVALTGGDIGAGTEVVTGEVASNSRPRLFGIRVGF